MRFEGHDLGTLEPKTMASLYTPLPNTSVTLYDPFQLATSLPYPCGGGPMFARQRTISSFSRDDSFAVSISYSLP